MGRWGPRLLAALALVAHLGLPARASAAACEGGEVPGERLLSVPQRAVLMLARELPLETKIGQLLMSGFVGTEPDHGLLDRVARGRVGGLLLLGRNVRTEDQVQRLTAQLDEATAASTDGIHPFLATDFEGGLVNALRAVTGNTASAAQLAARGVEGVEAQAEADAAALRWLGFNTNLAPIADVLTVPSAVIGSRAFSIDATAVSALSRAYVRGLKSGGVIGVMKHFPGHGATIDDSHVMLPTVDRSAPELHAADLIPYRNAIDAGELEAVMVGHLLVPSLDHAAPTSLSRAVITGTLRDTLRFDGLVMTDELKMRAISATYGVEEAALLALQAGVDVILADWTGLEQEAVFASLVRACHAGQLPAGRLEQSVARVLRLKLAYGLAGDQLAARYAAHVTALGVPAEPAPDMAGMTGMAGEDGMPSEPMPMDGAPVEGMVEGMPAESMPAAGETPAPERTPAPTPPPTPRSTQPTPTAVSVQPTPTRPPSIPTMTASPSSTPPPAATRTATATRAPS
ncbi:MAG: glycoside hydrolase family 3 N-terminal domain-containing protein [Chloroflexota bacterium]